MAQGLQDILTELNSVYDPQRQTVNSQLNQLDPQQQAEQQGLQAQKQDSFQQITDQANRRGLFYSGLPIQEEQKYTGSQFLPAVANLQAKYANQRFGLQDALSKITADQYNKAYDVRQGQLDTEEKAAAAAANARALASSASPSFGLGNAPTQNAPANQAGGINWSGLVQQNNPYVFKDLLTNANETYFGGKASYGQLANWLQGQIGQIPHGSAADNALRSIFLGSNLNTGNVANFKSPTATSTVKGQQGVINTAGNVAGAILPGNPLLYQAATSLGSSLYGKARGL